MFSSGKILSSKLRKALAQLPYLPRALKLVWEVARPWTTAWIVLLIVQGLLPAAMVYLTKVVVDGVVRSLSKDSSWPVFPLLLLGGLLLLLCRLTLRALLLLGGFLLLFRILWLHPLLLCTLCCGGCLAGLLAGCCPCRAFASPAFACRAGLGFALARWLACSFLLPPPR